MQHILVTGGCGFVGSSLAIRYKQKYPDVKVSVLDNLKRRGSELNLPRLQRKNICFYHGDIRNREDIASVGNFDLLVECAAEPSVVAGFDSSPDYVVNTNLLGTINCLAASCYNKAAMIFISTSRVYPYDLINCIKLRETNTRFEIIKQQDCDGISDRGLNENFPLFGPRSLYGATKLASELLITEYIHMYGLKAVINRCGLISGPWQFGKVDQGVVVLWMARHYWEKKLSYIGFGGTGKQVRDMIHVDDLFELIDIQSNNIDKYSGQTYNVGGGRDSSLSLLEMTAMCEAITGNQIEITPVPESRPADVAVYLSDCSKVIAQTGWEPRVGPREILFDIYNWISENENDLEGILR
ncbi:MAG TPA: NAD-dependent epimerase/dehydratase family protein [candidate division Zixibacteria bacterium]|nr:NAD-dependent epimerase/dehydratase family protein [candidate division Zixibacteria bacterium]